MTNSTSIKLTLSEEEFRLLNDLVDTAGQFVNAGHFSRTVKCTYDAKSGLSEKLRKAGEKSGIENVYGIGLEWFHQAFAANARPLQTQ